MAKKVGLGIDDTVFGTLAAKAKELLDRGVDFDEVMRISGEAFNASVQEIAPILADALERSMPKMLREHKRLNRGFERRLRWYWGPALDLYYAIVVSAEETGSNFREHHLPDGTSDALSDALLGLHARACRVAFEIHSLLSAGFPMGALARARTLHEIAVTAMVLGEYGREPEHPDLAERFLLHSNVQSWKDALVYQEHYEALGEEPFGDEELAAMQQAHDDVVARFGRDFKEPYGWAIGLPLTSLRQFDQLEKLARISHLRGYYRWASHEVHSDAKGWAMNSVERGGVTYLNSSRSNVGLADPGQMALISLHQVSVALLVDAVPSDADVSAERLVVMLTLQQMLDDALLAFKHGADEVEKAEQRYWERNDDKGARNLVLKLWHNARWHLSRWP